jgi:hypothetical protein
MGPHFCRFSVWSIVLSHQAERLDEPLHNIVMAARVARAQRLVIFRLGVFRRQAEGRHEPPRDLEVALRAAHAQRVVIHRAGVVGRQAEGRHEPPRDMEVAVPAAVTQRPVIFSASILGRQAECRDEPPRDLEVASLTAPAVRTVVAGAYIFGRSAPRATARQLKCHVRSSRAVLCYHPRGRQAERLDEPPRDLEVAARAALTQRSIASGAAPSYPPRGRRQPSGRRSR